MIGIDLERVSRFRLKHLNKYHNKFLSAAESNYISTFDAKKQLKFIAARFSAKEAIFKALGVGISTYKFTDITILPDALGKPVVTFLDFNFEVSISYCDDYVQTIALKKE